MSFHLKSVFPALAEEIEAKLVEANYADFVKQVATLVVTDRCHCDSDMCAEMVCGFHLEDVPLEEEHLEKVLVSEPLSLEVRAFKGEIVNVEVLFRPGVKLILDELIPVRQEQ